MPTGIEGVSDDIWVVCSELISLELSVQQPPLSHHSSFFLRNGSEPCAISSIGTSCGDVPVSSIGTSDRPSCGDVLRQPWSDTGESSHVPWLRVMSHSEIMESCAISSCSSEGFSNSEIMALSNASTSAITEDIDTGHTKYVEFQSFEKRLT